MVDFERFERFARNKRNSGLLWRTARWGHYRFLVPFRRNPGQPHVMARGAALGFAIGLSPTMGLQMAIILVLWWIANRLLEKDFSVAVAMAASFISNPATMVPLYYLYYEIGSMILGTDVALSRDAFEHLSGQAGVAQSSSWWDASLNVIAFFWYEVGPAMFVGCLPLMIIGGAGVYVITERLGTAYAAYRQRLRDYSRNARERASDAADTGPDDGEKADGKGSDA